MNVPNALSIFRLVLVPVFVIVYFSEMNAAHAYAAGIYLVAAATDYFDGMIARKYKLVTKLGRILDPLGDKIMTFAVLLCITIDKIIPAWAVVVFFLKECLMGIGGLVIYKKSSDMPPSNYLGKLATVVIIAVCAALILFEVPKLYSIIMISAAIAVMIAAFVSYLIRYIKFTRSLDKKSVS